MNIQVGLLDRSEIIKKMLSHCLQYYIVDVHFFQTLDACLIHSSNQKLDLVFVDWEMKQQEQPLIYLVQNKFPSIPTILMYRAEFESAISKISQKDISYRLKKPINPKKVRTLFTELVPEIQKSPIHSFLKFPASQQEKEVDKITKANQKEEIVVEEQTSKDFIGNLVEKTSYFVAKTIPQTISNKMQKADSQSPYDTVQPVTQQIKLPSPQTSIPTQTKSPYDTVQPVTQKIKLPSPQNSSTQTQTKSPYDTVQTVTQQSKLPSSQNSSTQTQIKSPYDTVQPVTQKIKLQSPESTSIQTQPTTVENTQNTGLKQHKVPSKNQTSTIAQQTKRLKIKINKDDIKLDENTHNDLAPMAIKTSYQQTLQTTENLTLNSNQILEVLNKYKDSLEFQNLMEKVLSDYAKDTVSNILEGKQVKDILQQPLQDFTKSDTFKNLVEKEIATYLKQQLPLLVKSIIENEIKKIVGE